MAKTWRFGLLTAFLSLFLASMGLAPTPRAVASGTHTIRLLEPSGAPMSAATVTVYLETFNPVPSFGRAPVLGSGTADALGDFSFTPNYGGSDPEINAFVLAVDPAHRWRVHWNLILPTSGTYSTTITANIDLSVLEPNAPPFRLRDTRGSRLSPVLLLRPTRTEAIPACWTRSLTTRRERPTRGVPTTVSMLVFNRQILVQLLLPSKAPA